MINSLREKSLINRLTWEVTMCDLQATYKIFLILLCQNYNYNLFLVLFKVLEISKIH